MATKVFFYAPHPDDEVLSMGLAILHHIAYGYDVHVVSVSRGEITPESIKLTEGSSTCGWHGWVHHPAREGYEPALTPAQLGLARLAETRSAIGAMSTVTPVPGSTLGNVFHIDANLPTGFGYTDTGVADVKAYMQSVIDQNPNSLHHTMSPTDNHPDHAACGQALRELKAVNPALSGSVFFVSRLYWDYSQNPDVAAQPGLQWYGTGQTAFGNKKAEYDSMLRNRVIQSFSAWNAAGGSYGIGYHQVAGQFATNFGPSATIANLRHT